jgi:hypothetical protein
MAHMRRVFLFGLLGLLTSGQALWGADIAGKWLFVMQTEGGERQITADFRMDADQVTGKWDTSDVKGTFKDGALELSFPVTPQETGETHTLKITGRLDGEALSGKWEFGEYSGTYKATRKT